MMIKMIQRIFAIIEQVMTKVAPITSLAGVIVFWSKAIVVMLAFLGLVLVAHLVWAIFF